MHYHSSGPTFSSHWAAVLSESPHIRCISEQTLAISALSWPTSADLYLTPGKTSVRRLWRSGMSSATSFGTTVSHTLWIRICPEEEQKTIFECKYFPKDTEMCAYKYKWEWLHPHKTELFYSQLGCSFKAISILVHVIRIHKGSLQYGRQKLLCRPLAHTSCSLISPGTSPLSFCCLMIFSLSLLMFPALTRTLFRARRPKS